MREKLINFVLPFRFRIWEVPKYDLVLGDNIHSLIKIRVESREKSLATVILAEQRFKL